MYGCVNECMFCEYMSVSVYMSMTVRKCKYVWVCMCVCTCVLHVCGCPRSTKGIITSLEITLQRTVSPLTCILRIELKCFSGLTILNHLAICPAHLPLFLLSCYLFSFFPQWFLFKQNVSYEYMCKLCVCWCLRRCQMSWNWSYKLLGAAECGVGNCTLILC